MTDDKATADAIVLFINYLLRMIDQSKLRFNEDDFLVRVFDPYYVKNKEYSALLVQDIPKRQRANIAIQTILRREEANIYAFGFFLDALFEQLEDAEISRVYKVISDELRITTDEQTIKYIIHGCPAKYWNMIEPSVRIRTEAILYENFSQGRLDLSMENRCVRGALATWITQEHLNYFGDLEKWTRKAIEMIRNTDAHVAAYAEKYFWWKVCNSNREKITWPLESYFRNGLKSGMKDVIEKLRYIIEYEENHPWWTVFEAELKEYPEIKYDPDDLPF